MIDVPDTTSVSKPIVISSYSWWSPQKYGYIVIGYISKGFENEIFCTLDYCSSCWFHFVRRNHPCASIYLYHHLNFWNCRKTIDMSGIVAEETNLATFNNKSITWWCWFAIEFDSLYRKSAYSPVSKEQQHFSEQQLQVLSIQHLSLAHAHLHSWFFMISPIFHCFRFDQQDCEGDLLRTLYSKSMFFHGHFFGPQ